MDKIPKIYKNKIDKLKTKVQETYYYHNSGDEVLNDVKKEQKSYKEKVDRIDLLKKIDHIFKRNDYVYQATINIVYKNGESIKKNIVGRKDKYLITMEGEKINIDDIYDIK